jgi:hypothetical protein
LLTFLLNRPPAVVAWYTKKKWRIFGRFLQRFGDAQNKTLSEYNFDIIGVLQTSLFFVAVLTDSYFLNNV